MKLWIAMITILLAVTGICVYDGIHTKNVFEHMEEESEMISSALIDGTQITNETLSERIQNLTDYWTDNMDMLCLSISRKDMQPISDYLQYLNSAIINENQEDAITYSLLLDYNIKGLTQSTGISILNLF